MLCWIFRSYWRKSVLLFDVILGLMVFWCRILIGVCSLFWGVTIVGLKIVVLFLNLSSIASWSDDLDDVEARAIFFKAPPILFLIGVFWPRAGGLFTEPPGRLCLSDLLLLICFKIGAIGFGVLNDYTFSWFALAWVYRIFFRSGKLYNIYLSLSSDAEFRVRLWSSVERCFWVLWLS